MAYRQDSADALEAPTADGTLRAELTPLSVKLSVALRTLVIGEGQATLVEHHKKQKDKDRRSSTTISGPLVVARDVPHEDVGIWMEVDTATPARVGMRRIFGVEPFSLMDPEGLPALAALDRLALRVKHQLVEHAGDIRRAFEIGRGLDKVLLTDRGGRFDVYARQLFRDRARLVMSIHDDGRIVIPEGKTTQEIVMRSRFGITVWGDYLRFADPRGKDLAKVSIPWIAPEDRDELARRIGQLVDRDPVVPPVWPPTS